MKKKTKDDPFAIAHRLVRKNVDPRYLHNITIGIKKDPVYARFLCAVEPRFPKLEREYSKLFRQVPEDSREFFNRVDRNRLEHACVWMDGAFTLGIALGLRMAGKGQKGGRS